MVLAFGVVVAGFGSDVVTATEVDDHSTVGLTASGVVRPGHGVDDVAAVVDEDATTVDGTVTVILCRAGFSVLSDRRRASGCATAVSVSDVSSVSMKVV